MGRQGDPQCRRLRQILERPDDRAIRGGDLAGKALPDGEELIPTAGRGKIAAHSVRSGTSSAGRTDSNETETEWRYHPSPASRPRSRCWSIRPGSHTTTSSAGRTPTIPPRT